nr:MAG TPA: hypothetical protein [Caudoviricetes sp.]
MAVFHNGLNPLSFFTFHPSYYNICIRLSDVEYTVIVSCKSAVLL